MEGVLASLRGLFHELSDVLTRLLSSTIRTGGTANGNTTNPFRGALRNSCWESRESENTEVARPRRQCNGVEKLMGEP